MHWVHLHGEVTQQEAWKAKTENLKPLDDMIVILVSKVMNCEPLPVQISQTR